ncbi:MAG: VWA domain-containing protein [Phycisphaerae bacterium]|nr:VWA domain-containing protein [Phycisphaerae bacterium]MDW8261827.1 VWA domain-containing protein [Phycisphaerales bacterium]
MSWFPTFLAPLPALAAAAVALPALMLLYFLKLRRREQEVASTLLWKKSIQDLQVNAPFQKLRKNLLLLLQLLLLLLLLLALSRPVSQYTAGAGKSTVILIDRSASMSAREEGQTRLELAKQKARELVDTMDRDATAMVVAFDEEPRTVQTFTSDRAALRRAIDSIGSTDRRTRLKLAYQLAEAQVAFIPEQNRTNIDPPEVWVFSDGRVADADQLQIRAPVKLVRIGNEQTRNIAIVALSARRNYDRPVEVQVFARLANFGPEPVRAQVQLSYAPIDPEDPQRQAFAVARVAEVSLPPARWTEQDRKDAQNRRFVPRDSVEFTLELPTAAVIRVEQMNRQDDALPADDAAAVVVQAPRVLSVLLVSEGNPWLEHFLAIRGGKEPMVIPPDQYDPAAHGDHDVTIFDRHSPAKLPPAGNFMYFGGVGPNLKVTAERSGGQPVLLEDQTVLDWRQDHPILRHLKLGRLFVATSLKLNVPEDSLTLVEGTKGPLLVLHREGRQTHLICAFDLLQSNWPLRLSFPPFLEQSLQFLALGADLTLREGLPTGASVTIPRANLARAPGGEPRSVLLIGPSGSRRLEVPATGDFALPPLDRAGIYRTEPAIPQFERLAVNLLDEAESNLQPVDEVPGGSGELMGAAQQKRRIELWWWIVACVAIPLTLLEWWVYTRRVHL